MSVYEALGVISLIAALAAIAALFAAATGGGKPLLAAAAVAAIVAATLGYFSGQGDKALSRASCTVKTVQQSRPKVVSVDTTCGRATWKGGEILPSKGDTVIVTVSVGGWRTATR